MSTTTADRSGRGWVTFSGLMLTIAGAMNILNGWHALDAQDTPIDTVFWGGNIEAWGWFFLVVGAVVLATGIGIFRRASWAIVAGVFIACTAAVLNALWIFAYPIASLVLIVLYVLVVYGLTTYAVDEGY